MAIQQNAQVTLEEMLAARENRVKLQKYLLDTYKLPLISFTMNIPGPVKVFGPIPDAFEEGCKKIEEALTNTGIPIVSKRILRQKTGCEAIYCAQAKPEALKKLSTRLEDADPAGRLYDIDIIRENGEKVSREEMGLPARACLLCGEPAHVCSRSRRHTVEELIEKILEILAAPGQP